jgi:hypothetical protein
MPGYVYRGDNKPESARSVGRPPKFRPELCGTPAGYAQHSQWKWKACDPCKQARKAYDAEYLAKKRGK